MAVPRGDGLCACDLASQNSTYAGTGGISCNNRSAGFFPAYQNTQTGEIVISRFADGSPAPVHVLDGLPRSWILTCDETGCVRQALQGIVAGFVRDGAFYTREAAARLVAEAGAVAGA